MLHFLLLIFDVVFGDDNKRILLNNNDVLYAKFHQMELKIQSLESQMMRMQKGDVYTRWGRKTCPGNWTELAYTGKTTCYDGWKREYFGKLAGGSRTQPAASQFVCLDNYPEVLYNGVANNNGKLFYAVKARCGSLPCPPYTNNALMTCVVCSK